MLAVLKESNMGLLGLWATLKPIVGEHMVYICFVRALQFNGKPSKKLRMPLSAASTRYSLVKGERIVRSVLTARLRELFFCSNRLLNKTFGGSTSSHNRCGTIPVSSPYTDAGALRGERARRSEYTHAFLLLVFASPSHHPSALLTTLSCPKPKLSWLCPPLNIRRNTNGR